MADKNIPAAVIRNDAKLVAILFNNGTMDGYDPDATVDDAKPYPILKPRLITVCDPTTGAQTKAIVMMSKPA